MFLSCELVHFIVSFFVGEESKREMFYTLIVKHTFWREDGQHVGDVKYWNV